MALDSNSSLTGSQNNQAEGGLLIVDQSCEHFSNESAGLSDSFVDLTEEARQEGLNSEIKLNFPLNGSFYNTLRADKSSDQAMHADLLGTSFVINKQKIDRDFILRLHGQYNHLILLHGHHSFAMQIFTEMFKHVRAKTPNDLILKELVTNCNGYNGSFHRQLQNTFIKYGLVLLDTEGSINIECDDSNCVSIKYHPSIPISNFDNMEEKICELNCSLEFTLESQNGEIEYTNGKVGLIIPKKLTNYSNNVNILIDKIKEHFLDTGKFMGLFSDSVNKVSRLITPDADNEEQLEFPLTQFLLEQLKAGKNNACADSGKQSHRDLHAMDFIINDKIIDKSFVKKLYGEHSNLITDGGKKYHPFVKQIFIEMFKHAGAEIPNDLILEELVINCNQAGYEAAIYTQIHPIFVQYGLVPTIPEKTMRICCNSVNSLDIEYNEVVNIKNSDPDQQEQYKSRNKLVFTLESRENDVIYKDGKVELIAPKKLKKYCNMNGTSLLDEINEHFSDKKGEEVVLETPAQSTLTQIQGIADFAIEFTTEVVKEGCEEVKKFAEAGYKAMFDPTKVQEQEEESMISSSSDEYHEVAPPMAFADVKDILDKAKQGDYEKLDAILSNKSSEDQPTKMEEQKEESMISSYNDEHYEITPPMACADVLDVTLSKKSSEDQLITDLNDENFKNFCSQYLNLGLQREEHENLLYKYQTENTYLVKELMLLAIVANEKLTEKYSKDILSNQVFYKKDFIPLLLFVCCEDFVQNLSNHIEKLGRNIGLYDRAFTVIEAALSAENKDCVEVMINLLKGAVISSPDGQVIMTPLEFSVQFCPIEVTEVLLEHGIDSGADKALSLAIKRSDLEVVKLLVTKGVIVTDQIMEQAIKINQRCVERDEQSVTEGERKARKEVVQFLTPRFEGSQPANSQKSHKLSRRDSGNGSSPDISDDEVRKKAGNLTTEENNDTINTEGPVKGFLSNSNNKELNMLNNNDIEKGLSDAIENMDLKQVKCWIEQKNAIVNQGTLEVAEKRLAVLEAGGTRNKNTSKKQQIRNMKEMIEFLKENQAIDTQSQSSDSGISSGSDTPVSGGDKALPEVQGFVNDLVNKVINEVVSQGQDSGQLAAEEKDEEYFDASDGSAEDQQLNVAETKPDDNPESTQEILHSAFLESPSEKQPQKKISTNLPHSTLSHKEKRKERQKARKKQSRVDASTHSGNHGDNVELEASATSSSNHGLAIATGKGVATIAFGNLGGNSSRSELTRDDISKRLQALFDRGYSNIEINIPANGNISNTLTFDIGKMLQSLEETMMSFPNLKKALGDHRLLRIETGDAHLSSRSRAGSAIEFPAREQLLQGTFDYQVKRKENQSRANASTHSGNHGDDVATIHDVKTGPDGDVLSNERTIPANVTHSTGAGDAHLSSSSGAKNDGWAEQSLEGTAEEADKLLDEQERPSDEPDASKLSDLVGGGTGSATDGGVSPSPSKVSNVNLPGVAKEADKSPDEQGQPSNPVDGGAGSATENGASSDGNQSDTSKKSARPYNIAALLLLGGGIGATIAAPVMYFVFYASLLEAGVAVGPLAAITAGVGAFLFIAAAVVHFCKPQTLSEDSNVKQVAPGAGQGTNQNAASFVRSF